MFEKYNTLSLVQLREIVKAQGIKKHVHHEKRWIRPDPMRPGREGKSSGSE